MSPVLSKSNQSNNLSSIFTEVKHTEELHLSNPEQLRIFHLDVSNNLFNFDGLADYLIGIISEYVFSRAQVEKLSHSTNPHSIGIRALKIMKKNSTAATNDIGNELGEILLYAFMEDVLEAPKLFSKVELNSFSSSFGKSSDAVHLLTLKNKPFPCYQTVFGSSDITGDMCSAIDKAFNTIEKIEHGTKDVGQMLVDSHIFEASFDRKTAEKITEIMLPSKNKQIANDIAYGIFLGYSLGLNAQGRSNIDFRRAVDYKMQTDIKHHTSYIINKIKSLNLGTHSFYIYIVPFNDADNEKIEIIRNLLE